MLEVKSKKRVGILRGGTGGDYASSLKKGGDIILYILENLNHKYKPVDILIDKDHIWHLGGLPVSPSDLVPKVDVVWNITHPNFSNILDSLSIPNTGVSSLSYTLENSRDMLRQHMAQIGIPMPRSIILPVYQKDFDGPREKYATKKAKEVFEKFGSPWVVKSFPADSNTAVHFAKTFPALIDAIEDVVVHNSSVLIEEFIPGKVASLHCVSNFRNEDIYVFPPVNVFGDLLPNEKERVSLLARDLHRHVGAKHYLKLNFVLNSRGKVYLLECESAPNLKSFSHFAEACESVGTKMHDVVDHILNRG